jgi:predicted dehydrogenase
MAERIGSPSFSTEKQVQNHMIRIGIVGCGRILAAHLRGYRLLQEAGERGFAITALCARDPHDAEGYIRRGHGPAQRTPCSNIAGDPLSIGNEYLSDFQETTDVEVFTDYRKMIAQGKIDAVMDLTSHGMHHLVAEESFRHRKHLLSQKPLAATVKLARQMCEQADKARVAFGTFECFRFLPATRALHWLYQSGRGGKLQMVLIGYIGAWWAPNLIVANTPWRHRKLEGGGITIDFGVHFFDQLRLVAGRPKTFTGHVEIIEPLRVERNESGKIVKQMECDSDDTCFATATFENGTVCQLSASWAGHIAPTIVGSGSVFYGTKSRVDGSVVFIEGEGSHQLVELFKREAPSTLVEQAFPKGIDDWFALGQRDWLEAIRHDRAPESSGEEGLADLAAAFAILESAHAGRQVSFDEVLSGKLRDFQKPIDDALEAGKHS